MKLPGFVIASLLLTACGGNDSDQQINNTTTEQFSPLSGSALAEVSLSGAEVKAICRNGSGFNSTVKVNEKGLWQGQVKSSDLPCRLEVTKDGTAFHGYAAKSGNYNISPFTDLVIAYATSQMPGSWFTNGTEIDESRMGNAEKDILQTLIEKGYTLSPDLKIMTNTTEYQGSIHSQIHRFMQSIEARVVQNTLPDVLIVVKDGNLNQIPEKVSLQPSFNGKSLDLTACDTLLGNKTQFSQCTEALMADFKLAELIDKQTGEACTLEKNGRNISLTNGRITIQAQLSKGLETMNGLNLGNGFSLNLHDMFVRYEFGTSVVMERTIELNVSDAGQLVTVRGGSKNPDVNLSCEPKAL